MPFIGPNQGGPMQGGNAPLGLLAGAVGGGRGMATPLAFGPPGGGIQMPSRPRESAPANSNADDVMMASAISDATSNIANATITKNQQQQQLQQADKLYAERKAREKQLEAERIYEDKYRATVGYLGTRIDTLNNERTDLFSRATEMSKVLPPDELATWFTGETDRLRTQRAEYAALADTTMREQGVADHPMASLAKQSFLGELATGDPSEARLQVALATHNLPPSLQQTFLKAVENADAGEVEDTIRILTVMPGFVRAAQQAKNQTDYNNLQGKFLDAVDMLNIQDQQKKDAVNAFNVSFWGNTDEDIAAKKAELASAIAEQVRSGQLPAKDAIVAAVKSTFLPMGGVAADQAEAMLRESDLRAFDPNNLDNEGSRLDPATLTAYGSVFEETANDVGAVLRDVNLQLTPEQKAQLSYEFSALQYKAAEMKRMGSTNTRLLAIMQPLAQRVAGAENPAQFSAQVSKYMKELERQMPLLEAASSAIRGEWVLPSNVAGPTQNYSRSPVGPPAQPTGTQTPQIPGLTPPAKLSGEERRRRIAEGAGLSPQERDYLENPVGTAAKEIGGGLYNMADTALDVASGTSLLGAAHYGPGRWLEQAFFQDDAKVYPPTPTLDNTQGRLGEGLLESAMSQNEHDLSRLPFEAQLRRSRTPAAEDLSPSEWDAIVEQALRARRGRGR